MHDPCTTLCCGVARHASLGGRFFTGCLFEIRPTALRGRPAPLQGRRWQADLHLPALPLHWPDPPPPSVGLNVLVNNLCRVPFPACPPPNTHLPPPQATRSAPSAIVMAVHVTAVDRPILQLLVIAGRPWRGDAKCLLSCCGRLSGGCQLRVGARLCAASFFAATYAVWLLVRSCNEFRKLQ